MARQASGKPVIFTNVGNPQVLKQKPVTFPRQVLALCLCPDLLDRPETAKLFARDVIARARTYLSKLPGGTGAYQDSRGNAYVREEVARFISERDGYPAKADDIYLTDGASPGIQLCLRMVIRDNKDGVLVPVPQYPLYSASITLLDGQLLGYPLDETDKWSLSVRELDNCVRAARQKGITPRAMVVINPGNPVGTCLSKQNLIDIINWCRRERIVLFADEVYQGNVYGSTPFVSFKKLASELGVTDLELFSFHSVSKGFYGECGRRGGYFEAHNIHPAVKDQIYKVMSLNLSTNVLGQLAIGMMVNPPKPGEPSFPLFQREKDAILTSLARRAKRMSELFNSLPGVSCQPVDGAMYAFPRIDIPLAACQEAQQQGMSPDTLYCLELLDATGICTVPGSGFGQEQGTYHFRTTILPPEDEIESLCEQFATFHRNFLKRYPVKTSVKQQSKL